MAQAQEWIKLEEARASVAGTSQTPIQPVGVATDVAAMTQIVAQNNQGGNNKRKGSGEGDQSRSKKNKSVEKFKPIYATYTDLTNTHEHIFLVNSTHLLWKKPKPLKNQRGERDPSKFFQFHNDIGHSPDDCQQLKDEIETLIRARPVAQYARN